jgi:glycosyltransferase involved in cell wall biosynthesis
MASSLPVLSTDVGDVAAMLAPDNLPFVAPQDDAMLASRLQNLLRDPATRARIGAANRIHVLAHYTQDAMFTRYAALFDGIPDPEG